MRTLRSAAVVLALAAILNCSCYSCYLPSGGADVRVRRLVSRTHWFLKMDDAGNVSGTRDAADCYSILEIRTVREGGVLVIKGVQSQNYLSMDQGGQLRGKRVYTPNCDFQELILENYFNAYVSATWTSRRGGRGGRGGGRQMFLALSRRGKPLRGGRARRGNAAAHFVAVKEEEG